jgi:large subunit ribosomal protein L23
MNANDVLLRPVISEKTTEFLDRNKYVFQIPMKANKVMVSSAVKDIFGFRPEKVNIIVVRGKKKRLRMKVGRTSAWKKAIVTLKPGDKIEIFEGK